MFLTLLKPLGQTDLGQLGQVEEKVLGLADHGDAAINLAARINQVLRVQQCVTLITLIAPGGFVAADWARPLHVAVRQEAAAFFAEELLRLERLDVSPVI